MQFQARRSQYVRGKRDKLHPRPWHRARIALTWHISKVLRCRSSPLAPLGQMLVNRRYLDQGKWSRRWPGRHLLRGGTLGGDDCDVLEPRGLPRRSFGEGIRRPSLSRTWSSTHPRPVNYPTVERTMCARARLAFGSKSRFSSLRSPSQHGSGGQVRTA